MIVPFHVTEMLKRVLARYDATEAPRRMSPKDDAFTMLRPLRRISRKSIESY